VAALISNLEEPLAVARHRTAGARESALNGFLVDYAATGAIMVPLPNYWSASSLSDYGKCPFRFWMSNILRIQPCIEPQEGLSRKLLGQTYHKALELFYKEVIARGLSIKHSPEEKLSELLDQAATDAIAWLEGNPEFRKDEFWDHRRKEIRFRLNRFFVEERSRALEDPEDFVPLMTEARFGFEHPDSSPPLKVVTSELEIMIRGQVDRIDVASASKGSDHPRLRIIDYKTGSAVITKADARSGRNLQLPLYALAVENAIVPEGTVVKAEYLSVAAAKSVGRLDFEKEKAGLRSQPVDLLGETLSNISEFVSGIQRGDFSVRPSGRQVCQMCDHKMICRVSELPQTAADEYDGDYESH
jgi:ATP-dependent helicase/DNAse subunit B